MSKPTYTFVINTYPSAARTEQLTAALESVFAQTFQDFSVLLVENYHHEKNLKPILEAFSDEKHRIDVIHDKTKKLSHMFDIGWRHSKTKYLAYIADDVAVEPEWLETAHRELTSDESIGVVTGPIISEIFPEGEMHRLYYMAQKNLLLKILSWPYLFFAMENNPLLPGKLYDSGAYSMGAATKASKDFEKQEIDLATTSSMVLKREALKKVDGFDKRFNFNHADGDLFIRIKKAGYAIVFHPKVVAHHYMRMGLSRNAHIIGLDTGFYYKKHVRPKTFRGFIGAFLNMIVLNVYWIYNTARTGKLDQLKGISGFALGLLKNEEKSSEKH